jgi:microcystin degradation protein MlrC
MRIAIAGFMHESNTFNPLRTDRAAFLAQSLTFGPALLDEWRDAHHEVGGFLEAARTYGFDSVPIVMAWATPSGPITDTVFEEITSHVIERLHHERPDGLLLALHGAMVADSHLDADGEIASRIRRALPELPVAVTLDLHGNISQRLVDHCDLAVAYRTNPHVDQRACGLRAASLLLRRLRGEVRPCTALAKPPMIVNIMTQDTSHDPLRSFMEQTHALEAQPGILATSLLPGFAWSDVPQMGPSVLVVSDGDPALARLEADRLASRLWDQRERFSPHLPTPAEAVAQAVKTEQTPVVLVDTGDNVGGGSAGDGTILLAELLQQGATGSVVTLYAPGEVQRCFDAGISARLSLRVGGKVDRRHGEPLRVRGVVRRLHDGNYVEPEVRHGGRRFNQMGPTVLFELPGDNLLVLTTQRHPPFSLGALTCLGIEPAKKRILVVKAAIAYKAAYAPVAKTILEVDSPGLTAVNPERFDYRHIRRPLYPLQER